MARKRKTIREAILAEIRKRQMSGYALVKALAGKVSRTAVYRFINDGGSCDVDTAQAFMDFLEIECVPTKE